METDAMAVLPAPENASGAAMADWLRTIGTGAAALLHNAMEYENEWNDEVREAAIWIVHDLSVAMRAAAGCIAGERTKIVEEPVGRETPRLRSMAQLLRIKPVALVGPTLDAVVDGIGARLQRELASAEKAAAAQVAEAHA